MAQPLADYVKLPELEEYKEWFKDFADLYREDGILQVTWKTNDHQMCHSGMSHRAASQLTRFLSLDYKNEIIIFTHLGDSWMTESDPNGWETYSDMSNLAKRPLKKLFMEDLKLHTVSEQYGSLLRIAAGEMGDTNAGQQDEKYISQTNDWRYQNDWMQQPPTRASWEGFRTKPFEWFKEVEAGNEVNPFELKHIEPYRPKKEEK